MAFEKLRQKAERGAARDRANRNDDTAPIDLRAFTNAGLAVPKGISTQDQFFDWLASQPVDIQNKAASIDPGKTVYGEIQQRRVEALRNGEVLPGMTESGGGVHLEPGQIASLLQASNIQRGMKSEGEVSQNPLDYGYTPALTEDVGYSPQDRYKYLDEVDPLEAALEEQAINQVRTDTTGVDAQKNVLGEYANLYAQGGLNAIDRARLEQARRTRAAQGRSAEEAILADMEERGRAGSNAELLARQQAQQGATNARSMDDLQTMALGLQRRDALLRDQGSLGGQVQSAQDVIDQFNTLGERDRSARNVDRTNRAGELTFTEGNRRESVNAAEFNRGVDTEFGYKGGLASERAGQLNRSREFNVSPNQGARGMQRDMMGARGFTAGFVADAAGSQENRQTQKDEAEEAAKRAWLTAGTQPVSALVSGL